MFLHGFGDTGAGPKAMKSVLKDAGYDVRDPGYVKNTGDIEANYQLAVKQLKALAKENGRVTLIGHSLGGNMSRRLAAEHPELVERVVRLGSGDSIEGSPEYTSNMLLRSPEQRASLDAFYKKTAKLTVPAEVPLKSISAGKDALVFPSKGFDPSGHTEKQRVAATHLGILFNWPVVEDLAGKGGLLRTARRP